VLYSHPEDPAHFDKHHDEVRRVLPLSRPWFDGDTIRIDAPVGGAAAWTITYEDLLADLCR
jgi:hypothetical protein